MDCAYAVNADYDAAKNVARKLPLKLQQRQKSPAGGAPCQSALNSGVVTVTASELAADTFVSIARESTDKPTPLCVGN